MRAGWIAPALPLAGLVGWCGGAWSCSHDWETLEPVAGSGGPSTGGWGGAQTGAVGGIGGVGGGVGGRGGGAGAEPCTWTEPDPCGGNTYCAAIDCSEGTCAAIPDEQPDERVPVCGCDYVTYWNAYVAAAFGMPVRRGGECTSGDPKKRCGGPMPTESCPQDISCKLAWEDRDACITINAWGDCWGMPHNCNVGGQTLMGCWSGGGAPCMNECMAIKTSEGYYPDDGAGGAAGGCP